MYYSKYDLIVVFSPLKYMDSDSNRELSDTIMNVVGAFMWVSVGATALHYWQGYMADHDQVTVVQERTVSKNVIHFINHHWR